MTIRKMSLWIGVFRPRGPTDPKRVENESWEHHFCSFLSIISFDSSGAFLGMCVAGRMSDSLRPPQSFPKLPWSSQVTSLIFPEVLWALLRSFSDCRFYCISGPAKTYILRGPPKGDGKLVPHENGQKMSKIFSTLFDDFWRFLTWSLSAGPFCGPLIFLEAPSGPVQWQAGDCDRQFDNQKKGRRKGNGGPVRGNRWPRKGNRGPCNKIRAPFNRTKSLL